LNPALLDMTLKKVTFPTSDQVLVDASHADDAGIIRISDEIALVQTIDFFTPVVDDPYLYGQIAACNALSDIYAMGATPLSALNIICFPDHVLDDEAFSMILQGGADMVKEAGAVILGGHSISDKELKYGLAVNGYIKPEAIKINHNLNIGDHLILTKPIGTGILSTALKNGEFDEAEMSPAISSMLTLNREPALYLDQFNVSACTDITGYGLLGHLWEMLNGLNCGVNIFMQKIPFFDKAIPLARESRHIPGGTLANQQFNADHVVPGSIDPWYQNLLYDPQTSGGLLISIPEKYIAAYLSALSAYPLPVAVIGEVIEGENKIYLT
jgi:selenide,water dikinase